MSIPLKIPIGSWICVKKKRGCNGGSTRWGYGGGKGSDESILRSKTTRSIINPHLWIYGWHTCEAPCVTWVRNIILFKQYSTFFFPVFFTKNISCQSGSPLTDGTDSTFSLRSRFHVKLSFWSCMSRGSPLLLTWGTKNKQTLDWWGPFSSLHARWTCKKCWSVLLIENLFAFSFFSFGKSTAVHRAPGESKDNLPPFPFPGIHLQMFVCFTFPIIVLPVSQRCANDSGLLVQTCFETFWCSTRSKVARWSA